MRESDEKTSITCKVTSTGESKFYTEVAGKHTLISLYILCKKENKLMSLMH